MSETWKQHFRGMAVSNADFAKRCIIACSAGGYAYFSYRSLLVKNARRLPKWQSRALCVCSSAYALRTIFDFLHIRSGRTVATFLTAFLPAVFFSAVFILPLKFSKPLPLKAADNESAPLLASQPSPSKVAKTRRAIVAVKIIKFTGATLFWSGLLLGGVHDYQRKVFKSKAENAGKLYTEGLAQYSRHMNYFGDVLLFTGWALLSGQKYLLALPSLMFIAFVRSGIPDIETYLASKYSAQWPEYEANVKSLVPFLL